MARFSTFVVVTLLVASAHAAFDVSVKSVCVTQNANFCEEWSHTGEIKEDTKCFPADAMIAVPGDAPARLGDLRIGDAVVGWDGHQFTNTTLSAWLHLDAKRMATFLQIHTVDEKVLEVSPEHSVGVWAEGCSGAASNCLQYAMARTLVPGESLVDMNGAPAQIASIEPVTKLGTYAPYTPTATYVVNDFVVHAFATLENPTKFEWLFSVFMDLSAWWYGEHVQPSGEEEYMHPMAAALGTATSKLSAPSTHSHQRRRRASNTHSSSNDNSAQLRKVMNLLVMTLAEMTPHL